MMPVGRGPHFHQGKEQSERETGRQTDRRSPSTPPLIIISACADAYAEYRVILWYMFNRFRDANHSYYILSQAAYGYLFESESVGHILIPGTDMSTVKDPVGSSLPHSRNLFLENLSPPPILSVGRSKGGFASSLLSRSSSQETATSDGRWTDGTAAEPLCFTVTGGWESERPAPLLCPL